MPSYVWLLNVDTDVQPRYKKGGFLGDAFAPLEVGRYNDNLAAPGFRLTAFDPAPQVTPERLEGRLQLKKHLESQSNWSGTVQGNSFDRYQERAADLVTGPEARRAFDLAQEPEPLRRHYGCNPLGQNLLAARRLIEAGVRIVTVNAWVGLPEDKKLVTVPQISQGWDHHGAASQKCGIFSNGQFGLGHVLPRFDQAVAALLEDLEQRGLLNQTLVVVVGEFGRTPKIVNNGYPGRDHHPACYSALLAGGGIRGGMVYGASDKNAGHVRDNPVSPENFGATLFHALGIAPETRLSPDGATHPASAGQPILDVFA
jgi:hypothetical protein